MLANLDGPDFIILIIVVAVLLFGGAAIPKLARNLGSAKHQFEQGMKEGKAADESTSAASDTKPQAPAEEKSQGA